MLFIAFPAWEIWGAKKPMVPKQIFEGQKVVALALIIVFIAGKWIQPSIVLVLKSPRNELLFCARILPAHS